MQSPLTVKRLKDEVYVKSCVLLGYSRSSLSKKQYGWLEPWKYKVDQCTEDLAIQYLLRFCETVEGVNPELFLMAILDCRLS